MTQSEIKNIQEKVTGYIRGGRLRDALRLLRNTTEAAMLWEIGDSVARIEQNYAYMLRYLTEGATDPGRNAMYAAIVTDTYRALDTLTRRLRQPEQPTLYFNTLRVAQLHQQGPDQLLTERDKLQVIDDGSKATRIKLECIERDIFNTLWVTMPLPRAVADNIVVRVLDPAVPHRLKVLMITALTLGLLEYFDSARMDALVEIYINGTATLPAEGDEGRTDAYDVTSVALAGMLLALFKYRDRPMPESTAKRLAALGDVDRWRADLRIAFLELIQTRSTEQINRTMTEDIIPRMMRVKPDIIEAVNKGLIDPENIEANPEWEELMKKSGIADRLRELSELQTQGSDVFMSTFSHLKNFPFFNELSNWFVPFEARNAVVTDSALPASLTHFIERLPFLCSSDKYSFFLSLSIVPESQKKLMISQFEASSNQMMEDMAHSADNDTPDMLRRSTLSGYLRNLYRFYCLFRRKGEFYDPFADGINLLDVDLLTDALNDTSLLNVVAELLFKFKYWDEAFRAFARLDALGAPDGAVLQKMGYCRQCLGDNEGALDYYHQAEIFAPDNRWLLGRMAAAYAAGGAWPQAAEYYTRLCDLDPESVDPALRLGYVYLQQKNYEEALRQFYKVEYLADGPRAWRPLAWTLFLAGRYNDAAKYYEKIAADKPTAGDCINMGHLALVRGNHKDAVDSYRRALVLNGNDTEKLIAAIKADRAALTAAGITPQTTAMIIDALLYSLH